MDELDWLRQRVGECESALPPEPWRLLGVAPVPGITEVGFADDSEVLLVLSSHSRELIDCRSGKHLARDTTIDRRSSWYGSHELIGNGFGPVAGRQFRLAGPTGGGLSRLTDDGWNTVRLPLHWPDENLLLLAPYNSIYQPEATFWKVGVAREPVAWGFSYSGKTLLLATADEATIFARD